MESWSRLYSTTVIREAYSLPLTCRQSIAVLLCNEHVHDTCGRLAALFSHVAPCSTAGCCSTAVCAADCYILSMSHVRAG